MTLSFCSFVHSFFSSEIRGTCIDGTADSDAEIESSEEIDHVRIPCIYSAQYNISFHTCLAHVDHSKKSSLISVLLGKTHSIFTNQLSFLDPVSFWDAHSRKTWRRHHPSIRLCQRQSVFKLRSIIKRLRLMWSLWQIPTRPWLFPLQIAFLSFALSTWLTRCRVPRGGMEYFVAIDRMSILTSEAHPEGHPAWGWPGTSLMSQYPKDVYTAN